MKIIFSIFFALLITNNCYSQLTSGFSYLLLNDYNYSQAQLKEGTEVEILSFSDGDACQQNKIFYKQFIVIDKSTNDTLRILSECQEYDIITDPRIGYYYSSPDIALGNPVSQKPAISATKLVVFNNSETLEKGDYKTSIGLITRTRTN